MAVMVLLILHAAFCVGVFVLIRTGKIRTRHMIFPAVVLLPVCGFLLLLTDERQTGKQRKLKNIEDYETVEGDDVWQREVRATGDDALTVPLEEAMTVNNPAVSRKLMMKLLHTNPEKYVELLKKVTLSDDVELTHYATTSMMEIQSRYEDRIGRLLEEVRENPDDADALVRCRNQLRAYIDSGLISDTILMQYRRRLEEVLDALCRLQPGAVRYEFEYIENSIRLGRTDKFEKRVAVLREKLPQDARVYRLYVEYFYCMHNGEGIAWALKKLKEREIYLDNAGKQWLAAWETEKV